MAWETKVEFLQKVLWIIKILQAKIKSIFTEVGNKKLI